MNPQSLHSSQPDRIGQYQIASVLGRGGMGIVYLARDTRLEREVAIKCLRTELFETHYIERFKREALLLAKLNHPNIVQIYDFIESPEQLALVMEYVGGDNLYKRLREQLVPMQQRLRWLTQITQGLAVAHDAGIIHRDLKAENILLNKRNEAKISDLGIAKSQDFNATLTDHVAGSYCSMSPEQAMGEPLDFKSDLFSLGILAYQLLCGAHPFGDTSNKLQVMQRIISHSPIPPQKHNPSLPVEICNLLGQLLSKNPENRPDNTGWVAAEFERLSLVSIDEQWGEDETQALTSNNVLADLLHKDRKLHNTGEHPTFDTRFTQAKLSRYKTFNLRLNTLKKKLAASALLLIALSIAAYFTFWQPAPLAPIYLALLPVQIDTNSLSNVRLNLAQELTQDAIRQSILSLNNYYLIPEEGYITLKDDIPAVLNATNADEIISPQITCKPNSCSLTISRIVASRENNSIRLRTSATETLTLLPDDRLSTAEIIQQGLSRMFEKNLSGAYRFFSPEEYDKYLKIFHLYTDTGESQELLNQLNTLSDKAKSSPSIQSLFNNIALDLHRATNNPDYLDMAEKFLNTQPTNIPTIEHLICNFNIILAKNEYVKASEKIIEIQNSFPGNPNINLLNASLALAKKDYSNAIDWYKKSLATKPSANTFYLLAVAYWYTNNFTLAHQNLNNALQMAPTFNKALFLSGTLSLTEGDAKEAINALEKYHEISPNDISNQSNLGLAYMLDMQYLKALKIFNDARKLAPQNPTLTLNTADILDITGNTNRAKDTYNEVIKQTEHMDGQDEASIIASRAQAFAHLGYYSLAMDTLKMLEKRAPRDAETYYAAALVYSLSGDINVAVFNINKAVTEGFSSVWFNLPWFKNLCQSSEFVLLMQKHNNSHCSNYLDKTF